jgi:DNA-directed RNA polymerase specialized sigma24 family protein
MTTPNLVALTRVKGNGTPYARSAAVEEQLRSVLEQPLTHWPSLIPELHDESLVYLIRHHLVAHSVVLGQFVGALSDRAMKIIPRYSKGFDRTTAEMIAEDVLGSVMEDLFAFDTSRQQFMECDFYRTVKTRTVDRASRDKHRFGAKYVDPDEPRAPDEAEIDREDALSRLCAEQDDAALLSTLAAIKNDQHREAFRLRYIEGWSVTDEDATKPTLCSHFKKSDRQIRNWIAIATKQVRAAIGESP